MEKEIFRHKFHGKHERTRKGFKNGPSGNCVPVSPLKTLKNRRETQKGEHEKHENVRISQMFLKNFLRSISYLFTFFVKFVSGNLPFLFSVFQGLSVFSVVKKVSRLLIFRRPRVR